MILFSLFYAFLKIGLFTVGSGYSMLVLAQHYTVKRHGWLTLEEFTDLVAVSEVTPGPIIFNLATFSGTRVAGLPGAAAATLGLLVIPFTLLYLIAAGYSGIKDHPLAQNLLKVMRPLALGLIAAAVINLFKTAVPDPVSAAAAVAAVLLVTLFKINPIHIILAGIFVAVFIK